MENFNVKFAARMSEIIDILGSVSELSRRVDVAYPTANKWVKDGAEPSTTNLIKIANAAGVNVAWLATGEGEKFKNAQAQSSNSSVTHPVTDVLGNPVDIDEFVFIPRYDVKAAAGHGYLNDNEKPRFSMAFRKYWVENYLSAAPKDLSVISVKGDSMEGVLNERDNILVDHSKKVPTAGLYVLRIGAELIVKRIQALPGNKLLVISANEAYPPFEIDLTDQTSDFEIIGRVVWFGRQI